ncbi:MAG: adenylate/guanylate cyclase domain-containing protein, partial [Actinobacteria bacterium]
EEFLTGRRGAARADRVLSTVLFTDIVDSTTRAASMGDERWLDLLSEHDRIVRAQLDRFRGREVRMTGDGCIATFDGPARAVACGLAITEELAAIGIAVRAGVHTGEVEIRDGEIGGLGVHIASRVMDQAERGGVLVSGTVKDLVVGSGIDFASCGVFDLKGVPGEWPLYEVRGIG